MSEDYKLICPHCKREDYTTSFEKFEDNGRLVEERSCDHPACGKKYRIIYEISDIELQ